MSKKKAGRPRKTVADKRSYVRSICLSGAERDAIVSAAESAGVPPTRWMRERLVEAAISQTNVSRPDLTGVPTISCV